MKGQYLTIEYLIFFIIGISLVIIIYYTFSDMNSIAERNTVKSQLSAVGEMVMGAAIDVSDASSTTKSSVNYSLQIPTKLADCIYEIRYNANGLNLNCTQDRRLGAVMGLYNLNITTKNTIYSTKGYVEIIAYNQTVELR